MQRLDEPQKFTLQATWELIVLDSREYARAAQTLRQVFAAAAKKLENVLERQSSAEFAQQFVWKLIKRAFRG